MRLAEFTEAADTRWKIVATDERTGIEVWNNGTNQFEVTEQYEGAEVGRFSVKQKTYDRVGPKMLAIGWINHVMKRDKMKEEAAGVGIITKQNTTADVKPGETTRQANKYNLGLNSAGHPKTLKP